MKALIGLVVAPALGFPVLAGFLLLSDHAVGDRLLAHGVLYEQRALAETLIAGYTASLPWMYAAAAVLTLSYLLIDRAVGPASPLWLLAVGLALGWVTGAWLDGSWLGASPLAFALAGAVLGAVLAWPVSQLRRRPRWTD